MQGLRRSTRRKVQPKLWNPVFSTCRPLADVPFILERENIPGFERGTLDYFLRDVKSAIPSWKEDAFQRFMETVSLNDPQPARARLDDRAYGTGKRRDYDQEWLTPEVLRDLLLADRFGTPTSSPPDADRRLIYINRLSPEYIKALVDTVYQHQIDPLRDAIAKHIDFETSIRVQISKQSLPVFVLEFHLPFPTLRGYHATSSAADPLHENQRMRGRLDVSYLQLQPSQHGDQQHLRRWLICEAHTSIVICGWDNSKWVGWAFVNAPRDPFTQDDEEADDEGNEGGPDDEPLVLEEDYFAADGNGHASTVEDANRPIWDPRRYWLRIIELRIFRALEEWDWCIRFLERGIEALKDKHVHELTSGYAANDQPMIEQLFRETVTTMQILGKLHRTIKRTLRVWTAFTAASGDYRYFSELKDPGSLSAFKRLRAAFISLDDLQHRLHLLEKTCKESQTMFLFYQERVSNRLSCQSQLRADHAHELNRQTNEISHKIHVLNRTSTEAAKETTEAARETSRGTRVNVLLFGITTPLVLVLQYFGADRDIFHFDRTPRTFAISLTVMCLALSLLTYLLSNLDRLQGLVLRIGKRGRKNAHNGYGSTDDIELVPPAV